MSVFDDAKILSDLLDRECIALVDQVEICGGVLAAALMALPPQEQHLHLAAHLSGLISLFGAAAVKRALHLALQTLVAASSQAETPQ